MFARQEKHCAKLCGKNNFPQHMVYLVPSSHTIYGVMAMTKDSLTERSRLPVQRANALNFLLFVTGVLLGCLAVQFLGFESSIISDFSQPLAAGPAMYAALLSNGKFLILLYLLAFLRCGAALVPPLFGAEGAFFGAMAASVVSAAGPRGTVLLAILLMFRLFLVLPYGFLLGNWSILESLSFDGPNRSQHRFGVLLVTLAVLAAAAFLECTLARWLGGMYYLKFGV